MIKWKQFIKRIPNKVRITRDTSYEILWVDDFHDEDDKYGETRLDDKQIVLNKNQSNKELVHTYYHELLHALSHEYDVGLTETQVRKLERSLAYILKDGNVFKDDK